jgi:hypothetical protein
MKSTEFWKTLLRSSHVKNVNYDNVILWKINNTNVARKLLEKINRGRMTSQMDGMWRHHSKSPPERTVKIRNRHSHNDSKKLILFINSLLSIRQNCFELRHWEHPNIRNYKSIVMLYYESRSRRNNARNNAKISHAGTFIILEGKFVIYLLQLFVRSMISAAVCSRNWS